MLKVVKLSAIVIAMIALVTGCTSYHQSNPSSGLVVPVGTSIKASVEIGGDVSGQSSLTTILGFINLGDSEYADGVSYAASSGGDNPGLLGGILGGGGADAPVKAAASLKAVRSGNCDFIVDPRYTVTVNDFIIFKTIDVTVKGKAGKVTGYTAN